MNRLNQKGFGLVEGLLIVVATLILGFGGYYVYSQNTKDGEVIVQEDYKSSDESTNVENTEQGDNSVPAGWNTVSNKNGSISMNIPAEWQTLECDSNDTFYFGSTKANLGFMEGSDESILCGPGTDFPPHAYVKLSNSPPEWFQYHDDSAKVDTEVAGMNGQKVRTVSDESGFRITGFINIDYSLSNGEGEFMQIQYNQWPEDASDIYDKNPANEEIFYQIIETLSFN